MSPYSYVKIPPMAVYTLKALELKDKNVLLRLDLDLPENQDGFDTTRLEAGAQTLNFILKRGAAKVHVIGHRGRPDGKVVKKLSLKPITDLLIEMIPENKRERVTFGDNLRFDPGEEGNSKAFAKKLAKGFDFYVNDGFATAHREHASMVQLPLILPTVMGRTFEKEIKTFQKVYRKPDRPVTLILGGGKSDKAEYLKTMFDFVNVFVVGGKLAAEMDKEEAEKEHRKLIVCEVTEDGLDITKDAYERAERFIKASGTVIWNGPMGKYEDGEHGKGTEYIADTLSRTKTFSIIGGGDTEAAVDHFEVDKSKYSHVSTGGGAMMEFFANGGTLPAYEAIVEGQQKFSWEDFLEFIL